MRRIIIVLLLFAASNGKAQGKAHFSLFTDRNLYTSGETILFNVFVPDTDPSGVIKVNLITTSGKIISEVSKNIKNHQADGFLYLSDSLKTGTYLLSTYTKVSSIVSESRYDTYSIGTVSNFVGEGGYTSYRFEELTKKLDLTAKYGDVKIDKIPANFESLKFNGGYTSLKAGIDPAASYMLNAEVRYGSLKFNNQGRFNRNESNNSIEVDGLVGEDANTKSKVNIVVKYGGARLE